MQAVIESLARADHPFWSWSKSIIIILAATAVLYHNASSFDITELRAIGEIAVVVFGATGLHQMLKGKAHKDEEPKP